MLDTTGPTLDVSVRDRNGDMLHDTIIMYANRASALRELADSPGLRYAKVGVRGDQWAVGAPESLAAAGFLVLA